MEQNDEKRMQKSIFTLSKRANKIKRRQIKSVSMLNVRWTGKDDIVCAREKDALVIRKRVLWKTFLPSSLNPVLGISKFCRDFLFFSSACRSGQKSRLAAMQTKAANQDEMQNKDENVQDKMQTNQTTFRLFRQK